MILQKDRNTRGFLALLRAGLWEEDVKLLPYREIDFSVVQQLAEEQSVVGLVSAGMEHVVDTKIPKQDLLQFIGQTLQIEEQNKAMNYFIGVLVDKMRVDDIYTLLVKGQGVAQCYERPLWRMSGDVDFYLSDTNYTKAKEFITPLASSVEEEDKNKQHYGVNISPWTVELHGTMYTNISPRINQLLDEVHHDLFYMGEVRSWNNDRTTVFLPSPQNDIIIVFTHFINHFYGEGIGLKQICDWCRLLWTFRESINRILLKEQINKAGLMKEWKTFGALAVESLGMPSDVMPFYSENKSMSKKADKLINHILETGHIRSNQDEEYRVSTPKIVSHIITFWRRLKEFVQLTKLFPLNAPRFFVNYLFVRIKAIL